MRAFISRVKQMEFYKSIDRIHDPSVYDVGQNDSPLIEVDTFSMDFSKQEALIAAKKPPLRPKIEKWRPPILQNQALAALKKKKAQSYAQIREKVAMSGATIIPRTSAQNRKRTETTLEEEQARRADVVAAQIKVWRSLLPSLLKDFSKINDPRRAKSIEHKLTTLMIFGLFAFIFQLQSRREMNRELTGPVIFSHLKTLFPDLETIPHADTLARLLEKIHPREIEQVHLNLIHDLIKKKKFKKLLINQRVPISIDGTQKLFRDGLLQDARWCERKVSKDDKQQYVYVIEATITLRIGLSIPLMSEYLYQSNHQLENSTVKQDNELTAFERLAAKLKRHFPRLKIVLLMDSMYATQNVMTICNQNNWDFMITLPREKMTTLAAILKQEEEHRQCIPGQAYYRERKQEFYWKNHVIYGDNFNLPIHLVGCRESYDGVNSDTGEIEKHYSSHAWISSMSFSEKNVHELCNLGARKKELIEDCINTEKNRGYHYKHVFSYDWNAMQGFHCLMRLGHAINAVSEFSKKLKQFIKNEGCSAILKLIKETLFSPWLSMDWYEEQLLEVPQLRLYSG